MRKLMMLAALLAVALLAASPALAQDEPKVVADAKAKTATAGGAKAEANCEPDQMIEAKAGGVVAKAPCPPPPPPPPPPKAAPAPKQLPPTGGSGIALLAPLIAVGAGALLVGGGLLVRRFVR